MKLHQLQRDTSRNYTGVLSKALPTPFTPSCPGFHEALAASLSCASCTCCCHTFAWLPTGAVEWGCWGLWLRLFQFGCPSRAQAFQFGCHRLELKVWGPGLRVWMQRISWCFCTEGVRLHRLTVDCSWVYLWDVRFQKLPLAEVFGVPEVLGILLE